jgi:hypothetical protein
VDKACKEGGVAAAKIAMKEMLKAGRAANVKHQCDDCHLNDQDYSQMIQGAEDKFKRLLDAVVKK